MLVFCRCWGSSVYISLFSTFSQSLLMSMWSYNSEEKVTLGNSISYQGQPVCVGKVTILAGEKLTPLLLRIELPFEARKYL